MNNEQRRRKFIHLWVTALLAVALAITPLPLSSFFVVQAETADDPPPEIWPRVENGKKVLFDNTHGQTAGAADWVIDGGFSDFANALADDGYYVKELRQTTAITYDDLRNYDVFVIGEANVPYKASEQQAMLKYVKNGGSIFFIADHYNADRNKNRWDASEVFNGYRRGAFFDPAKGMSEEEAGSSAMQGVESSDWLAEHFGVRFRYNALGDVMADHIVAPQQAFGITAGVREVAMHAGSTLAIIDPTKAKGIVYLPPTEEKWPHAVDQGVYAGGGIDEGPFVAVAKVGKGKAAFIGDSSPVEDATPKYVREETGQKKVTYDGFKEVDDGTLLVNTVRWLAERENYTKLTQVKGLTLDEPTPLLPFEEPEQSTEPQEEPWAPPAPGYKWWDTATFKPGAYGSPEPAPREAEYDVEYQAVLPNTGEFNIRVIGRHLKPGQTVPDFTFGIYRTGGEQVAKVQRDDGSWPSGYGYSAPFSLKANARGVAVKELTVKIKPDVAGNANLRLRQNKNNLLTKAVTIDNVAPEPLPEDTLSNDSEPPATAVQLDGEQLSDGSYVHNVRVALTATDDRSGVDRSEYRLGESPSWNLYEEPVVLGFSGERTFHYRSLDRAGNAEQVQDVDVRVTKATAKAVEQTIREARITNPALKKVWLAQAKHADRWLKKAEQARLKGQKKQAEAFETSGFLLLKQTARDMKRTPDRVVPRSAKDDVQMLVDYVTKVKPQQRGQGKDAASASEGREKAA